MNQIKKCRLNRLLVAPYITYILTEYSNFNLLTDRMFKAEQL